MMIRTKYATRPNSNVGKIVARGIGGLQKSTKIDQSKSMTANHGIAAANLIIHANSKLHPLERQNADDLRVGVVRSLDAGYGSHTVTDNNTHIFEV